MVYNACNTVGQAAVGVALHYGANVFATIQDSQEFHFVKDRFPKLPERNIFAEDESQEFKGNILRATKGQGRSSYVRTFN